MFLSNCSSHSVCRSWLLISWRQILQCTSQLLRSVGSSSRFFSHLLASWKWLLSAWGRLQTFLQKLCSLCGSRRQRFLSSWRQFLTYIVISSDQGDSSYRLRNGCSPIQLPSDPQWVDSYDLGDGSPESFPHPCYFSILMQFKLISNFSIILLSPKSIPSVLLLRY